MPLKVKSVASGFVKSGKFSAARGSASSSSNPLPTGRFVPARVRRLDNGDIQLLLEQSNPKKKRKKKAVKKAKRPTKKAATKRRPAAKKSKSKRSTKRSAKKSKR